MRRYPAKVIGLWVNGGQVPGGPYQPGPSSSFRYDLDVSTERGSTIIRGVQPQERRWPDTIDMWPFTPPDVVDVYEIGGKLYMKDAERVPNFGPCPGGVP